MSLILILIGYFFDYKYAKKTFIKELISGLLVIIFLLVSAIGFVATFQLTIIHGALYIGVEILVLFSLKAILQSNSYRKK